MKTGNKKNKMGYKEYRKIATVKAKLFEKGDEDGMIHKDGMIGAMEDYKYGLKPDLVPYISTLENNFHRGAFGKHYLCIGVNDEKWLVEKDIFEKTYNLTELRKPSEPEPIGRTDEDLVQEIIKIEMREIDEDDLEPENLILFEAQCKNAAIEIAKLLSSPRPHGNDSNMELLETLKQWKKDQTELLEFTKMHGQAITASYDEGGLDMLTKIITNYEKQIKR